jgi:predicted transcriptional regulator
MSDVSITVNLPESLRDRLDALSRETSRSNSAMTAAAIHDFVETEEEIIAGIKRGMADVAAGRIVPHAEAMRQIRATIDRVAISKAEDSQSAA